MGDEEKEEASKVELPDDGRTDPQPLLGDSIQPTTGQAPEEKVDFEAKWEADRAKEAQEKGRKLIKEEDNVHDEWYREAKETHIGMLPEFLRHLMEDYEHDYGTICHALTAGAIATIHCMDDLDQGGITGFQAGAVMWEFITHWMHKEGPMRLLEYGDMLYPQCRDKFEKVLTQNTFKWLQQKADETLKSGTGLHPDIRAHMENIVAGEVPFGYRIKEED